MDGLISSFSWLGLSTEVYSIPEISSSRHIWGVESAMSLP